MTAAVWRRRFSSGGSRSMRAASTACTVAGTCMLSQRLAPGDRPPAPRPAPASPPGCARSPPERRVALGARDQELLERRQAGVVPQQGLQELVGARRRQRVEPQLGVVGLAAPAVLVLRAVVDQQEQAGGRQALDQAVEQGLRLGIDPVQVFEDQQQGLHLAFAQQQALEGLEGALAALRGIEVPQRAVDRQRPAAPGAPGGSVLRVAIQGQQLPGDLGPDGARRRRGPRHGSSA